MAIPQGNFTAYQKTTATTKLDFGEMAENVAASEQARADKKKLEQEKRLATQAKIATNFGQDYDAITDVITGTKSIDEAYIIGTNKARNMIGDIYKRIEANPLLADDVETRLQLRNLNNFSKTLATSSQRITEFNTELMKGMKDGSLSNYNKKHVNIADSIYRESNLVIGVDGRGMAIGATIKLDDEGEVILGEDGKPIVEELSLPQILEGNGLPELVPNYNMAADAQVIGKDLAKRTKESITGPFSTNTIQTWDDMKEDARGLVRGYLGRYQKPSAEAKSIWSDVLGNNSEILTQEDMTEIEDAYLNSIKPFYDNSVKDTVDLGARQRAIEESNRIKELREQRALDAEKVGREEEAAKTKAEKGAGNTVGFTVITDQDGKPVEKEFQGVDTDLKGKATAFSLPTDSKTKQSIAIVQGPSGKMIEVTQLMLLDSGELSYQGFEHQGKGTSIPIDATQVSASGRNDSGGKLSNDVKRVAIGGGAEKDNNTLTYIAKYYGLDNEQELKQMLLKTKETFSNKGTSSNKNFADMTNAEKEAYLMEQYAEKK